LVEKYLQAILLFVREGLINGKFMNELPSSILEKFSGPLSNMREGFNGISNDWEGVSNLANSLDTDAKRNLDHVSLITILANLREHIK
jgi:hypothetical protein